MVVYRLLINLYVVVYSCITYIFGLCSVYIYRCHVLCIGAIIRADCGYIRLYRIVMWIFFFFQNHDDGFIKSLNLFLLWSFNYIYIIKVVCYKVIYILLIIGNITGMPHLKIVAYVIWFKTVLSTTLCCGWFEL